MTKDENIKEVMELVDYVEKLVDEWHICAESGSNLRDVAIQLKDVRSNLKSKLRELINEAHQVGYEAGWSEADEAMSWNRSM